MSHKDALGNKDALSNKETLSETDSFNLEALREDIDEIDRSLIALLESRVEVCKAIAEVKQRAGLPLRDQSRELEVISKLQSQTQDDHVQGYISSLYPLISRLCLEVQEELLQGLNSGKGLSELSHTQTSSYDTGLEEDFESSASSESLLGANLHHKVLSNEEAAGELESSPLIKRRALKRLGTGLIKRNLGRIRWRKGELANAPRSAPLSAQQRTWLTERGFAHRGYHDALRDLPENSLPAFAEAIAKGYGIELDVHLSRDGIPIVFHDEEMTRMTGEVGEVKEYSLNELKAMRLIPGDASIPTLAEALDLIGGQVPVLVEVKNYGQPVGPLESAVADVISDYRGPLAIQCFNPMSLKWFYRNHPHIVRGLIAYSFPVEEVPMRATTRFLLKNLLFTPICKPHYIAYEHQDLARHRLRRLHRMRVRGTPVLVWTVRTQAHADLAYKRADNIIFEGFEP